MQTGILAAAEHTNLIPHPINKKVLLKEDGSTRDIINEVLQTYADSRNQLKEFGQFFKGDTLLQTCSNIWHFWKEKVKYKIDPEGVQWVKTPAAFWNEGHDPFGDCKSFSIAVAASLHALDIKGAFRFVSFGTNTIAPTHVFVVVKDKGREIIIDCVWHSFNSTKQWSKKWDYNMTSIYQIAGIDTNNSRGMLDFDGLDIENISQAELDLMAKKQLLELEQLKVVRDKGIGSTHDTAYELEIMAHNNALAQIGRLRGNRKFRHQRIINFGPAGSPRKRVPQVAPQNLTEDVIVDTPATDDAEQIGLFGSKKRKAAQTIATGGTVKNAKLAKKATAFIDKQKKRNDAGKGISKNGAKVLDKLNIVVNKKKDGLLKSVVKVVTAPVRLVTKAITTTALRVTLPKNAPFFLYLFLADPKDPVRSAKILAQAPDVVLQKRAKALQAMDSIVKKIGMKQETFNTIIRSGILSRYAMQPEAVLAKWMKDANFNISGILDIVGGGLTALTSSLGIDFKNMEDAVPDPSDWGSMTTEAKNETADDITNLPDAAPKVKDESVQEIVTKYGDPIKEPTQPANYDNSGNNEDAFKSQGLKQDNNGEWYNNKDDEYKRKQDDATGDTNLNKVKVLPGVTVSAKKRKPVTDDGVTRSGEANTGLLILGIVAAGALMSGGKKSKSR